MKFLLLLLLLLIILIIVIVCIIIQFRPEGPHTGGSAMTSHVSRVSKSKKLNKTKLKAPQLSVTNIMFDADKDGEQELKNMVAAGGDILTFTYLPQGYIPKIQQLAPKYEHLCRYDIDETICCAIFSKYKFDYSINTYCANAVIDLQDRLFSIYVVYRPEYENIAKVMKYDTFNKIIMGFIPDNESLLETGYKRHSDSMYTLGFKSPKYTPTQYEHILLT